jgi:hypothetical protein
MNSQEYETNQLRHDLMAAETELKAQREKLIDRILEYAKLDHITVRDLVRIMQDMK